MLNEMDDFSIKNELSLTIDNQNDYKISHLLTINIQTDYLLGVFFEEKSSIFYAFLIFFVIFLMSAFRNDIGDTFQYKHSYSLLNNYKFSTEGDWGFGLFQYILYNINTDPQFLIIITSLILLTISC